MVVPLPCCGYVKVAQKDKQHVWSFVLPQQTPLSKDVGNIWRLTSAWPDPWPRFKKKCSREFTPRAIQHRLLVVVTLRGSRVLGATKCPPPSGRVTRQTPSGRGLTRARMNGSYSTSSPWLLQIISQRSRCKYHNEIRHKSFCIVQCTYTYVCHLPFLRT